jgi:heat shock protein HslJ
MKKIIFIIMKYAGIVVGSLISVLFISVAFAGLMSSKTPSIEPMGAMAPAEGTANNVSLEGTLWLLKTYTDNEGKESGLFPGSKITAAFEESRLSGSSGCNQYFGSYQTDGGNLSIGEIGLTMMFCTPVELMDQEAEYLRALANISSYKIIGNQLVMANAEGQTILLYEIYEPATLNGTNWNILFYNNGKGGLTSPLAGTEITALFGQEGNLSGNTGCNNYMSDFKVNDSAIEIGPVAATRMFCAEPEGIMEQEGAYLAALEKAKWFEIKGDALTLFDENQIKMAEYKPVMIS